MMMFFFFCYWFRSSLRFYSSVHNIFALLSFHICVWCVWLKQIRVCLVSQGNRSGILRYLYIVLSHESDMLPITECTSRRMFHMLDRAYLCKKHKTVYYVDAITTLLPSLSHARTWAKRETERRSWIHNSAKYFHLFFYWCSVFIMFSSFLTTNIVFDVDFCVLFIHQKNRTAKFSYKIQWKTFFFNVNADKFFFSLYTLSSANVQ